MSSVPFPEFSDDFLATWNAKDREAFDMAFVDGTDAIGDSTCRATVSDRAVVTAEMMKEMDCPIAAPVSAGEKIANEWILSDEGIVGLATATATATAIDAAVVAAVSAECEACAQVANCETTDIPEVGPASSQFNAGFNAAKLSIAAAILARK